MNELINAARRVLTLVSGAWILDLVGTEVDVAREPGGTLSHAHLGNGVRWSDIVSDIESAGVSLAHRS